MRVIAGRCRSMPLRTLPGRDTRPTTDRIKETLFNILAPDIPGCRFLDLFAGSGGIGIEALSRGAAHAVFVDQSRKAASVIRENLAFTKLLADAEVLVMSAESAIRHLDGEKPFDVIFMDPPYLQGLERDALLAMSSAGFVTENTLIVIEASNDTDFSWLEESCFHCFRVKRYKTNEHLFIRKGAGENVI